ncbi:MAG: hypothetical protein GY953_39710, partial [bacterium]|nr:hypothetical protein [bacterium]
EEVLGIRPVGVRDNFFAIGGHSLMAITLFARIDAVFGTKLPLGALFEAPTIEHLAQILRGDGWSPQWSSLVPIQPAGSKPPFFCVHAARGNVLFYADLARHLGSDYPVYGLQSAGVDGSREPYTRVEEMAAAYIKELKEVQPNGPYLLGGFCSGAYVALEMAHQLQERGERVPLLVSFNTDGAWKNVEDFGAGIGYHWRNLSELGLREISEYLATRIRFRATRMNGAFIGIACRLYCLLGRPLPDFLLARHVEEANRRATRQYRPHEYHGTLVYLQGSDEAFRDPAPFWGDLVEGLEVHRVPGSDVAIFQ